MWRWLERLTNSSRWARFRRRLLGPFPFPTLRSDVRDVIYANWLIPVERINEYIPDGVGVIERNGLTLLTILTYRHGNFGPKLAGPIRRLFPSPLQSNWRTYVQTVHGKPTPQPTVLFLSNIFSSALYTFATRLFSDSLPSHLAPRFDISVNSQSATIAIHGGSGSAPAMALSLAKDGEDKIPDSILDWAKLDEQQLLREICLQDCAIVASGGGLAEASIELPADTLSIAMLSVSDFQLGELLHSWVGNVVPWCFRLPAVTFTVLGERMLA